MKWITQKTNSTSYYLWWCFDRLFLFVCCIWNGAAVPADQLSASGGLIDSFILLVGGLNPFVVLIGIFFMYTLAANLISWSLGVNYVALYAAKNHDMPLILASKKVKKMICQ